MGIIAAQGMNFGFNVALGSATWDASLAQSDFVESGFGLGLLAGFDLVVVDLDVEANVSFFQTKEPFEGAGNGSISMLSVPATVRFTVLPLAVANVYVRGGVAYEKTLSAKLADDDAWDFTDETDSGIAWIVGVGAKIEVPQVSGILAELRFSLPQYDWVKDQEGKFSQINFQATILF